MAIILANDGIAKDAQKKLEDLGYTVDTNKYEGDALLKRLAEVDCIVVRSATKMRDEQIDAGAAGKLKLIIRAGVGLDNVNVDHAKSKGVVVRNTPAASSAAVAELVLGQIFTLARNLQVANRSMAEGKWLKKQLSGVELNGKTLGIVGFGRIGQCLAAKARALGMDILFYDAFVKEVEGYQYVEMDELLKKSDFISLHVPAQDKALIGKDEIAMMKDGSYIINAARGGVVDEDALVDALESGKLAGAALDCFKAEPLANERLMHCEKLSMTPHIGAATSEAQQRIGKLTVDIIQEVLGK